MVGGGVLLHLRHKELEQRRGEQGRGKREGEGGGGRATKRESVCVSPWHRDVHDHSRAGTRGSRWSDERAIREERKTGEWVQIDIYIIVSVYVCVCVHPYMLCAYITFYIVHAEVLFCRKNDKSHWYKRWTVDFLWKTHVTHMWQLIKVLKQTGLL